MPAWSPEIANEFIRLASRDDKAFNQMRLQELVYIAHGWCLASSGQPLTGDRPEAFEHGPEYRRLANALVRWGVDPVTSEIDWRPVTSSETEMDATLAGRTVLSDFEQMVVKRIYADYGNLHHRHLALVTRAEGTPWESVYAGGKGKNRDISHSLIKAQFDDVAARFIKE